MQIFAGVPLGTVVYAVAVNCLKNPTPNPNPHPKPNPIRNPTTNPIPIPNPNPTNPIPYSSGSLLLRRKLHLARPVVRPVVF